MARFLKGITGGYSGKIGNVIGSNWRNVDYIRSLSRPSKKAASPLQLAQREKFSLITSFLSPLKDLLNIGFSDIQQGSSTGYNQALGEALKYGVMGDYPNLQIDYSKIRISRGALANLAHVRWEEESDHEITLSWQPLRSSIMGNADDSVILLIYNIEKKAFDLVEENTRADNFLMVQFPEYYSGDTLVGWVFTGHRDGIKTSNSHFLGELVLR